MIVGVSGLYAAGKGEVVSYLEGRSFASYSLSDVLREELARRGEDETRERMIALGREIRVEEGEGGLARRLAARLGHDRNYVIDSIRHPAEVKELRALGSAFKLIWVEAQEGTRFERLRARARPGDPESLEALRELEGSELASEESGGQRLLDVRALADHTVTNDGSLEVLQEQVQAFLSGNLHFERPDWDDYFMSIARVVATRSNCVKRKVAAVLTIDRRVIATGYNGTPRGTRNCNEGGCPRCNAFGPGGTDLGECLCSHAEENAITQSAYHGVRVREATLYTTFCPCLMCTKMIINSGIGEVVYSAEYPLGEVSVDLLREAGVKVRQI